MRTLILAIAIPVTFAASSQSLSAQGAKAAPGAQEIAQLYTKQTDVSKQPFGVVSEKQAEVSSVPVVLDDIREYAGLYEDAEKGVSLELRVEGKNLVGTGTEPTRKFPRKFTLDRIRISGGLLTARKRYDDGLTVTFEAAFLERSESASANAEPTRRFGLGTRVPADGANGDSADRLFYERT